MRPRCPASRCSTARCSTLAGGFDFSACGDCASCPAFEQIAISNSEPSVRVRQDMVCMRGLYIDPNGEGGSWSAVLRGPVFAKCSALPAAVVEVGDGVGEAAQVNDVGNVAGHTKLYRAIQHQAWS